MSVSKRQVQTPIVPQHYNKNETAFYVIGYNAAAAAMPRNASGVSDTTCETARAWLCGWRDWHEDRRASRD